MKNKIIIRKETPQDYKQVEQLIYSAFLQENPEPNEHTLVAKLRKSEAFVPELSLVAELDGIIVGHILFTKIKIGEHKVSLALAPLAVLPKYQREGIGGILITEGHKKALELGYDSVVVLGHKEYYPKFGYEKLSPFGIQLPFDGVPDEYCMVIELIQGALKDVHGMVEYAKEFME